MPQGGANSSGRDALGVLRQLAAAVGVAGFMASRRAGAVSHPSGTEGPVSRPPRADANRLRRPRENTGESPRSGA